MRTFTIVAAVSDEWGIGYKGQLPWHVTADMKHFAAVTTNVKDPKKQNAVIMGSGTWISLPASCQPLPGRLNVVISDPLSHNTTQFPSNVLVCPNLVAALKALDRPMWSNTIERVFVIGGGQVYASAWLRKDTLMDALILTKLKAYEVDNAQKQITIPCDRWFPVRTQLSLDTDCQCTNVQQSHEKGKLAGSTRPINFEMRIETYVPISNKSGDLLGGSFALPKQADLKEKSDTKTPNDECNNEEQQYLQLTKYILEHGIEKSDRTGVGTLSTFGAQMRFSLRKGSFPLLTTKRVFWKGVVEELLWMLRGCTNSQELNKKKVTIWDDNGSRAFLDKLGFQNRAVGDLGPVYGFQWRHFGAKYIDAQTDYKGQGVDQIAEVMKLIKTNPDSRRILFSAWNPMDLGKMALPPCHVSAQFSVNKGELSCLMYQRSADMGLGVPFNIASYSLLTVLMAHACGLQPGEFVYTLGDCHVYKTHIDALKEQLKRKPNAFPTLKIKDSCKPKADVSLYTFDDLELLQYKPQDSIKMTMAV